MGRAQALTRMNGFVKLEQKTHSPCSSFGVVFPEDVDLIQSAFIPVEVPTNSRMPQHTDGTLCRSLNTDSACLIETRTESHQLCWRSSVPARGTGFGGGVRASTSLPLEMRGRLWRILSRDLYPSPRVTHPSF